MRFSKGIKWFRAMRLWLGYNGYWLVAIGVLLWLLWVKLASVH